MNDESLLSSIQKKQMFVQFVLIIIITNNYVIKNNGQTIRWNE